MNVNDIIARLHHVALIHIDDATSNVISKLAHRLAHQGYPFEKPLNEAEKALIMKYAGLQG